MSDQKEARGAVPVAYSWLAKQTRLYSGPTGPPSPPATIVQMRPFGLRMDSLSEAPVASSSECTCSSCGDMVRPKGSGNSTSPHFLALQSKGASGAGLWAAVARLPWPDWPA